MSERIFTIVFRGEPPAGNPFHLKTPYGEAICIAVGNVSEDADAYREALEEIAEDFRSPNHIRKIAEDALAARNDALMAELNRDSAATPEPAKPVGEA